MIMNKNLKYTEEIIFLFFAAGIFLFLVLHAPLIGNVYTFFIIFGSLLICHYFSLIVRNDPTYKLLLPMCLCAVYLLFCFTYRTWISIILLPYLLNIHMIQNYRESMRKLTVILIPNILFIAVKSFELIVIKPQESDVWHSWLGLFFLLLNSIISIKIRQFIDLAMKESENIHETIKVVSLNELRTQATYRELAIKQYLVERNVRLEERERISLSIHNAVGHTITTGLMAMDAAEALFNEDLNKAAEKLADSRFCVRQGLDIVRQAIRMIDYDDENTSSADVVLALITHIEYFISVTGLSVNHNMLDYNADVVLSRIHAEFLTNALLELLSNGSNHSDATLFLVIFNCNETHIQLTVSDNGSTFSRMSEEERREHLLSGYGLKKIEKNVLRYGGNFKLTYNEGFSVDLTIPVLGG